MKGGTTTLLKVFVLIIGIAVIVLCAFWLLGLASYSAEMFPEYAYLRFPVLVGVYVTSIPFFIAKWKGQGRTFFNIREDM